MPQHFCDCCKRDFSSLQYFNAHINASKNKSCLTYYYKKRSLAATQEGEKALSKRRALIQKRDAALRSGNTRVPPKKTERTVLEEDDSVFEFKDDSLSQSFLRVGILPSKRPTDVAASITTTSAQNEEVDIQNAGVESETMTTNLPNQGIVSQEMDTWLRNLGLDPQDLEVDAPNEGVEAQNEVVETRNEGVEAPNGGGEPTIGRPSDEIAEFKVYVAKAHLENGKLSKGIQACTELMDKMNRKGGSLAFYDEMIEWHVHYSDEKEANYVKAQKLHEILVERNGLKRTMPTETTVKLPHSKEVVNLAVYDVLKETVDLLTDPRIGDKDYLFFNNDPFAAPPDVFDTIGDINTGLAYRESYKRWIAPQPYTASGRRRVLLPYMFYLDGCVTGNYANLGLEILKFSIGVINGSARKQPYAWKNVGMMKKVVPTKKDAEENIVNSKHVESQMFAKYHPDAANGGSQAEGRAPEFNAATYNQESEEAIPTLKLQDFHKMLQVLLSSYSQMERNGGFPWDLRYCNKIYEMWFVPFVLFFKADSVEASKLTGLYGSSAMGVKCLCRVCICPTGDSDNPYVEPTPEKKTPQMIINLVNQNTEASKRLLANISQHPIWNAMYELTFGAHNNTGIHGAIPWDLLHWIRLNLFKNTRDCVFEQAGDKSKLSKAIDALCITFGKLLKRNSESKFPRIMFNTGIREAMLQANHMPGVIVLLTLVFRSTLGRKILKKVARGPQKEFFNSEQKIRNWSYLLERELMFEAWLRKDEFEVELVQRAMTKIKEVMQMVRKVGQRSTGMGDKRGVFHGALHIPEMILNFGAPKHFDTDNNESDHKHDKKTAKRTQQRADTFDFSVATKIKHREAVQLAFHEMQTGKCKWHYYRRLSTGDSDSESDNEYFDPMLSSVAFELSRKGATVDFEVKVRKKNKKNYKLDTQLLWFLQDMAATVEPFVRPLCVYSELKVHSRENGQQIYRATPDLDGSPWYDWGVFKWGNRLGEPKKVLGHMQCFVDLRTMPAGGPHEPGIYTVMEIATKSLDPDDHKKSELWEGWSKQQSKYGVFPTKNRLVLANTNQLRFPAVVVPDLYNEDSRAYLRMVPMWQWDLMFDDWLREDHHEEWK